MRRDVRSNLKWAAAFAALCIICAGIWLWRGSAPSGKTARIALDGQVVETIDLDKVTEPYEFDVDTPHGMNKVRVENGRIAVIDADCPDRICVDTGFIDNSAVPIVCLPHKLTITVDGESGLDAVAGSK